MENLPFEVLEEIFFLLDYNSMWNSMKVCKIWTEIFTNSSKLMKKFHLIVDKHFLISRNISFLPKVSIKNVKIQDLDITDGKTVIDKMSSLYRHFLFSSSSEENQISTENAELKKILKVLNFYKDSFENFEISNSRIRSISNLYDMLKNLKNLTSFKASYVTILTSSSCSAITFPKLKSISLTKRDGSIENYFDIFKSNKSIEKVELIVSTWTPMGFNHDAFNNFIKTLPNFKHLSMDGTGTASYFDQRDFPFKLTKADVYLLGFNWNVTSPRLNFLKSQTGSLKDLKLGKLPYDHDGGEVLKFIIEEMSLNKFYYGDIPLILNGQRQEVKEIWFNEVTVMAGMEMLRQFPSIKKLRFWLCATGTYNGHVIQSIQNSPRTFMNLQELKIIDHSGGCHELPKFIEIYKNCRNVKKLLIESNERRLCENFREFLPFMTQLEEINLNTNDSEINEKLQVIRENCLTLKIIKVKNEQLEVARAVFDGSDVMIEVF